MLSVASTRPLALIAVGLALALATFQTLPAGAGPAPQPTINYPPASITVGGTVITPGDPVLNMFGAVGAPDKLKAQRGDDAAKDYISMYYFSYNLIVDVKNDSNAIQSLLLQDNRVPIKNVPFKVGDSSQAVKQAWGSPDQDTQGDLDYWNYFQRGVMVGVDGSGRIALILIAPPGKFNYSGQTLGG